MFGCKSHSKIEVSGLLPPESHRRSPSNSPSRWPRSKTQWRKWPRSRQRTEEDSSWQQAACWEGTHGQMPVQLECYWLLKLLASDAIGLCCWLVPGDDSAQSFMFPRTPLAGTLNCKKSCINRLCQSQGPGGHYPAARLPIRSQGRR